MDVHRKKVRHFHEPGDCHELTFSCYRRMPLLAEDSTCRLLAQSLDRAMETQAFALVAFVFMPEHVHLLVYPTHPQTKIDRLLQAIKRPFSYRVKQSLRATQSPLLATLTIRERPGVHRFRFWQEGGGYDRNLSTEKSVMAAIEYIHQNPVRRQLCSQAIDWKWSSSRHDLRPDEPLDTDLPRIHGLPPEFF